MSLAKEISDLQTRITAYQETLDEINNLQNKHKKEIENLEEQQKKPNKVAIDLIEKINSCLTALNLETLAADVDLTALTQASTRVLGTIDQKLSSFENSSSRFSTSVSPPVSPMSPSSASRVAPPMTPPTSLSSASSSTPPPVTMRSPVQVNDRIILTQLNTAIALPNPAEELEKIRPELMTRLVNMISTDNRDAFKNAIADLKKNKEIDKNKAIVEALVLSIETKPTSAPIPSSPTVRSTQSNEEPYRALKTLFTELNTALEQQAATSKESIEQLNKAHQELIEQKQKSLYDGVPEGKREDPLNFLKGELNLKQAQLETENLKILLTNDKTKLSTLKQTIEGISIPTVAFQMAASSASSSSSSTELTFQQQLLLSFSKNQQQLSDTTEKLEGFSKSLSEIKNSLPERQKSNTTLKTKIDALPTTTENNTEVNALKSAQEGMQSDFDALQKKYTDIEALFNNQKTILEAQKKVLKTEQAKADEFKEILVSIGKITGAANLQTRQIKAHQYDNNVMQKPAEGKLGNPTYIIDDNQFYQTANQKKSNLALELTTLKGKKIANPSSPLDTAINQALDEKIATAETAINALQTAYTDRKTAWEDFCSKILLENLADPYFKPADPYFTTLINTVAAKTNADGTCLIDGNFVLAILKKIGEQQKPGSSIEKKHLIEQQNRAVFVVQQLVPKLSIDEVLKLNALVETKHAEDKNPYGYIRRELDFFRFKYGNTQPWKNIIEVIQARLNTLANTPQAIADTGVGVATTTASTTTASTTDNSANQLKLSEKQYKAGKKIMKTHVEHDYGFGFFYTPKAASEWKEKHKPEPTKTPKQ